MRTPGQARKLRRLQLSNQAPRTQVTWEEMASEFACYDLNLPTVSWGSLVADPVLSTMADIVLTDETATWSADQVLTTSEVIWRIQNDLDLANSLTWDLTC